MKKVFKIEANLDYVVDIEVERIFWLKNEPKQLSYSVTKSFYLVADDEKSEKIAKTKEKVNVLNEVMMQGFRYHLKADMVLKGPYFVKCGYDIIDEKLENITFNITEPSNITMNQLKDKLCYKDYLTLCIQRNNNCQTNVE